MGRKYLTIFPTKEDMVVQPVILTSYSKKGINIMKKKNLALGLAMLGIVGVAAGGSLAYMTEYEQTTNVFTIGDLDIGLTETNWDPDGPNGLDKADGLDTYPGYTVYKNPTLKNLSDNKNGDEPAYARMIIYVEDKDGNLIEDQDALDLIQQTIRYDDAFTGNYSTAGESTGLVQGRIPGYTLAQLNAYPNVNPDFVKDTARSTKNTWVYNYVGTTNGILKSGEEATLFTTVAVPTDWNQTQLNTIGGGVAGSYQLKVKVESIQAAGFADQDSALDALDAEIAGGTLQHITR